MARSILISLVHYVRTYTRLRLRLPRRIHRRLGHERRLLGRWYRPEWQQVPEAAATSRMIPFHFGKEARALELATGNGLVARWLAGKGASALATDVSKEMLGLAGHRVMPEHKGKIVYQQLDATSSAALDVLARDDATAGGFDVVVMNMAIMDVSTIEPLVGALPKLLRKGGVFVATLLHPIFFTSGARRSIQVVDDGLDGYPEITRAKVIDKYLDIPPYHSVALYSQPAQQLYYHRPPHELFTTFFRAGFVMDAMEEPAFTTEDAVPEKI